MPNELSTRPLPATRGEWLAGRRFTRNMTLLDEVDTITGLPQVCEDPEMHALLSSTNKENSVEGSVNNDRQEAARRYRDIARNDPNTFPQTAMANYAKIKRAISYALKRWGQSPNDRMIQHAAE